MPRILRAAWSALIIGSALSCGGSKATEPPKPVLTTLNVSFPNPSIFIGQSANASASAIDQFGAPIATGTITWTTESAAIATVSTAGVVTGVAVGQTQLIASAAGKQATASITVVPVPVATVTVTPTTGSVSVGATFQLTASTFDASSNALAGRTIAWSTADPSRATVSSTGLVTGVAVGTVNISATSEGKTGMSQITVTPAQVVCNGSNSLQLAVGEIHPLTASEKATLCVGGGASASEYALIPFNSTNVAASTVALHIAGTNTSAIQPGSIASLDPSRNMMVAAGRTRKSDAAEWAFRQRELRDLRSARNAPRQRSSITTSGLVPSRLTGIPANPTVGSIVDINSNISGNTCTSTKQIHGAVVVAVLPHTIVLSDTTSPAGGYTTAEMTSFGQQFDTLGYDLDVANFGTPTDIDANGRLAILFTPGVNVIPGPPNGVYLGMFANRDLYPVSTCVASNEGEMFYVPVPDPNKTLNGNYADKTYLATSIVSVLVHEFQHLINAGRRQYVNNAPPEEIWLNEGLSHVAEELLYYRMSGNSPRTNINLSVIQSSQAQIDAVNSYQFENLSRLSLYMDLPENYSPIAQVDQLEMRGAIWQLLRYAADRKGGSEASTWSALVNSSSAGQANFNAVFGDIIAQARDWALAQFLDDAGLGTAANYSHPSWNFRSVLPAINSNKFPLLTHPLTATPVDLTLNGASAGYIRFSVAASVPASVVTTASGQAVPSFVDMLLVRTQ